jgi:hypothetical protein
MPPLGRGFAGVQGDVWALWVIVAGPTPASGHHPIVPMGGQR